MLYLCLIGFIPIIVSLIITPIFSFVLSLMIFVLAPVYFVLMLITLKYIRKEIIAHSPRMGRMTARTGFLFLAIIPISVLILLPTAGPGIEFADLDYTAFILWGVSSIINFIAAILFKRPEKNQSTS